MLDVAIIGAGAAGLGAARAAISNGLSYQVLEAALFIGGRARTDTTSLGVPYDLGCRSFYGGADNPLLDYARNDGWRLGPMAERTHYHDELGFLHRDEIDIAEASFDEFEADIVDAHKNLSLSPEQPDQSQADLFDAAHPYAQYMWFSHHPSMAAAGDVSLADPHATLGGDTVGLRVERTAREITEPNHAAAAGPAEGLTARGAAAPAYHHATVGRNGAGAAGESTAREIAQGRKCCGLRG